MLGAEFSVTTEKGSFVHVCNRDLQTGTLAHITNVLSLVVAARLAALAHRVLRQSVVTVF